jgi:ATP-dependent Clp endopeptidase proteolytic subunit ClpP
MTNTIEIDGVIGWDVFPSEVSAQLKKFKGEPVDILFSSPGGYISDGLAIFNHIHDYAGETTAIIIGMAASMASYIPLAADKVVAKSNAVMMIHDPLVFTYGNQREHEKAAKILGGFANMLADIYAKKSGKSLEEIRAIMDEESFYFGSEMLEAGFVDEIDEIEVPTKEKDDSVLDAMLKFEVAADRIKTKPEDYSKIAAYFSAKEKPKDKPVTPAITSHKPKIETKNQEVKMQNFEQLISEKQKTGMKRTEAIRAVAKANPELHQKWIKNFNSQKTERQEVRAQKNVTILNSGFLTLVRNYQANNPGIKKSVAMKSVIMLNPEVHKDYLRQANA